MASGLTRCRLSETAVGPPSPPGHGYRSFSAPPSATVGGLRKAPELPTPPKLSGSSLGTSAPTS